MSSMEASAGTYWHSRAKGRRRDSRAHLAGPTPRSP